jgi:hypothetical protein
METKKGDLRKHLKAQLHMAYDIPTRFYQV